MFIVLFLDQLPSYRCKCLLDTYRQKSPNPLVEALCLRYLVLRLGQLSSYYRECPVDTYMYEKHQPFG